MTADTIQGARAPCPGSCTSPVRNKAERGHAVVHKFFFFLPSPELSHFAGGIGNHAAPVSLPTQTHDPGPLRQDLVVFRLPFSGQLLLGRLKLFGTHFNDSFLSTAISH